MRSRRRGVAISTAVPGTVSETVAVALRDMVWLL
jgi:hypothetical protein